MCKQMSKLNGPLTKQREKLMNEYITEQKNDANKVEEKKRDEYG